MQKLDVCWKNQDTCNNMGTVHNMHFIGVLGGGGRGGLGPPLAKIFSLAEQKCVAWQRRN